MQKEYVRRSSSQVYEDMLHCLVLANIPEELIEGLKSDTFLNRELETRNPMKTEIYH